MRHTNEQSNVTTATANRRTSATDLATGTRQKGHAMSSAADAAALTMPLSQGNYIPHSPAKLFHAFSEERQVQGYLPD